jgi:hypothetical protein
MVPDEDRTYTEDRRVQRLLLKWQTDLITDGGSGILARSDLVGFGCAN